MEVTSVCLIISATLSIQPDRSQFFRSESFTLDCAAPGASGGWTVRRNTSTRSSVPCREWGRPNGSSCINRSVYSTDSGLYWCQSELEGCSNVLNVTVNSTGVVILEVPALPVTAGDRVTLRCSYKERSARNTSSDFNATFYKDGKFVGNQSGGTMVLPAVSLRHQGFYKCAHPTKGESPQSLLAVRAQPTDVPPPPPPPPVIRLVSAILLFILYTAILALSIYTYRWWARARADGKSRAPERHSQD